MLVCRATTSYYSHEEVVKMMNCSTRMYHNVRFNTYVLHVSIGSSSVRR